MAFFNSNQLKLNGVKEAVQAKFGTANIPISSSYFRPSFRSTYGAYLNSIDFSRLNALGLGEHLNCICQIVEQLEVEKGEVEGIPIWTARGKVEVLLYQTKTGELITTTLKATPRAASSDVAALESLEALLLESENLEQINVTLCK
ncbi:MAG: hypothetical protein HC892_16420 [Saprospiraceae bacterium]|nr:hypothetical protein [Saprospiraceae bacterium]